MLLPLRHLTSVSLGLLVVVLADAIPSQSSSSLLVTPRQLARELRDPSLVLLEIGPKEDYDAGHIEGARFIAFRDIAAPDSAGALALELPAPDDLRGRLEALGIGDGSNIVIVSGADPQTGDLWVSPATRVVWTLQTAGLGSRTRLLAGGKRSWKREGLPLTTDVPAEAKRGRITATPDRSIVVDHAWMQAHLQKPGVRVVDGRAPVFFEGPGMPEHNAAAGHLPGAVNVPFNSLLSDSSGFLPIVELRRKFEAAGVQPGDTVAAYCHVGQQATVVLFSARLLGHPIRLYDGSMNDWERRKLPLVNPTAPKKPDASSRSAR